MSVWESTADRATQGFSAGFADARAEAAILAADGAPKGQPFDMAIDCDCTPSTTASYFRGANAAEPHRVNAYGGYFQVLWLSQNHLVGHLNWQTYAWSGGRWLPASIAPLEQYLNSNAVDFDRVIAANYAQWPFAAPRPPVRCFGPGAAVKAPKCKKIRPQVAKWSQERDSTLRTLESYHCIVATMKGESVVGAVRKTSFCTQGAKRATGFQRKINQALR